MQVTFAVTVSRLSAAPSIRPDVCCVLPSGRTTSPVLSPRGFFRCVFGGSLDRLFSFLPPSLFKFDTLAGRCDSSLRFTILLSSPDISLVTRPSRRALSATSFVYPHRSLGQEETPFLGSVGCWILILLLLVRRRARCFALQELPDALESNPTTLAFVSCSQPQFPSDTTVDQLQRPPLQVNRLED